jgi:hypothetical protein
MDEMTTSTRRMATRSLLTTAATVLLLAPAAAGFAAEPTPSLTAETLSIDTTGLLAGCDPAAASYTFKLAGNATGPYSGPYDATATSSLADSLRVTRVSFVIVGAQGQVTGTQTISGPAGDKAVCGGFADATSSTYVATITHGAASTEDHGGGVVTGADSPGLFTDALTSAVPPAPEPTTPAPTPSQTPSPPAPTPTSGDTSTPTTTPTSGPTGDPTTPPSTDPTSPPTTDPTSPPSPGPTNQGPADLVAFRYQVQRTSVGPTGSCSVDGGTTAAPVAITCTDVTRYRREGNKVTFSGHATINGKPTTYRIEVADLADPGTGRDVFRIETATGFVGGGALDSGNLRVR